MPTVRASVAAIQTVFLSGLVGVVKLWFPPASSVAGATAWATESGRLCGLLAAYLIPIQLILRARIPFIERSVPVHQLARWHGNFGRAIVVFALGHAALIWWGYARSAGAPLMTETRVLVVSYPDVLMATVALALFVCVGALAAPLLRQRIRYQSWYHLHVYVYLALALALAHELANGAAFAQSAAARAIWLALYATAAALLIWFRVVTPLLWSSRLRLRVLEVRAESERATTVVVGGQHLERLGARPGQYLRWRFMTGGMWWSANPYSLSAPVATDRIRFTAKALGDHSARLATLRPGTRVVAEGPGGALWPGRGHCRRPALLIAGGIGITPLRVLFETLVEPTLLYRASSPADLVFRAEIDDIASRRGGRVHYLVGRRVEIGDPLRAEHLQTLVPDIAAREIYICGPLGMTESTRLALAGLGVPRARIHTETFSLHAR